MVLYYFMASSQASPAVRSPPAVTQRPTPPLGLPGAQFLIKRRVLSLCICRGQKYQTIVKILKIHLRPKALKYSLYRRRFHREEQNFQHFSRSIRKISGTASENFGSRTKPLHQTAEIVEENGLGVK